MNPQPSWEELESYYGSTYEPYDLMHGSQLDDDEEIAWAKQSGAFRHIPIPLGKRLLDVGCGGGRFLRIAKKLGAIEQGIEPSRLAAEIARKQGLSVFQGTLESYVAQIASERQFDVITASHVVEHLPEPVETLRAMKLVLATGGFIWVAVPNAAYPISRSLKGNYFSTDLPRHLMQFTPLSMCEAGRRAGLNVRRQTTESLPRVVLASLTQYLRCKFKLPRRLTQKLTILETMSNRYARQLDAKCQGETILTEFVASE
jgi:2-polyprenyl-3-methyl-5-hydroxy-6-metoxy-1,4-benzoquinol methylase